MLAMYINCDQLACNECSLHISLILGYDHESLLFPNMVINRTFYIFKIRVK